MRKFSSLAILVAIGMWAGNAMALPILCQNPALNHMTMDSSEVTGCLDAGIGNISGNPGGGNPDPFLTGVGTGYSLASKDDAANPFNIQTTQGGSSGTWSIDPVFWLTNSVAAIGFKFGTGNEPDEWFVFQLVQGTTSGSWDFINIFGTGGGLSHTILYSTNEPPPPQVSEPGILTLLGLGGLTLGFALRRRRRV